MSHLRNTIEHELGQPFFMADFKRGERVVIEGLPSQGFPFATRAFLAYRTTRLNERKGGRFYSGPTNLGLTPEFTEDQNPYTVEALTDSSVGFMRSGKARDIKPDSAIGKIIRQSHDHDTRLQNVLLASIINQSTAERVENIVGLITEGGATISPPITMEEMGLLIDASRKTIIEALHIIRPGTITAHLKGGAPTRYELTTPSMWDDKIDLPTLIKPHTPLEWQIATECVQGHADSKLANLLYLITEGGSHPSPELIDDDLALSTFMARFTVGRILKLLRKNNAIEEQSTHRQKRTISITPLGQELISLLRDGISIY